MRSASCTTATPKRGGEIFNPLPSWNSPPLRCNCNYTQPTTHRKALSLRFVTFLH